MSIFGDEARRLVRKKWADVNEFADELFTLFNSKGTLTIEGPVEIRRTGAEVPLIIRDHVGIESTKPVLTIDTPKGLAELTYADLLGVLGGSGGSSNVTIIGGGGITMPGVVVTPGSATDGTGYVVDGYPSGYPGQSTRVTANIPGLTAGEQVTAGSWGILMPQTNGKFAFAVPLWQ